MTCGPCGPLRRTKNHQPRSATAATTTRATTESKKALPRRRALIRERVFRMGMLLGRQMQEGAGQPTPQDQMSPRIRSRRTDEPVRRHIDQLRFILPAYCGAVTLFPKLRLWPRTHQPANGPRLSFNPAAKGLFRGTGSESAGNAVWNPHHLPSPQGRPGLVRGEEL